MYLASVVSRGQMCNIISVILRGSGIFMAVTDAEQNLKFTLETAGSMADIADQSLDVMQQLIRTILESAKSSVAAGQLLHRLNLM